MCWVTSDDADWFHEVCSDEWDAPVSFTLGDARFLAWSEEHAAFSIDMLLVDIIETGGAADKYFSNLPVSDAGIAIFASRDESLTGRCMSVQRRGASLAVTLVHSQLEFVDIVDAIWHIHEDLEAFSLLHSMIQDVIEGYSIAEAEANTCLKAGTQGVDLATIRLLQHLDRRLWKDMNARDTADGAYGQPPDLSKLLEHAPGPVVQIPDLPEDVCGVTIMGGDVAVLSTPTDEGGHMVMSDIRMSLANARAVFVVYQHIHFVTDLSPDVTVYRSGRPGAPKVCVDVRGVPVAHVTHIIEVALRPALIYLRTGLAQEVLEHLLTKPCTRTIEASIEARHHARVRAYQTIARAVDANLEAIKARLWRPDGRLAMAMFAHWDAEV